MIKQPPKKPSSDTEKTTTNIPEEPPQPPNDAKPDPVGAGGHTRLSAEDVQALPDADLEETLKVLRAELRRREAAHEASRPRVGSKVRILRGRPKYIGKVGTAVIVRRSRCFVAVPDLASPAYTLISDLELLER